MLSSGLVICGNSRPIPQEELEGYEVWALGVGKVEGADRYYELHGLESKTPCYRMEDIPIEALHRIGLPLTNSICIMLAHAVLDGRFSYICIKGSPLRAREYKDRQADLAFICGYAKGRGISIQWEESGLDLINIYMGGKEPEGATNG